ncbi:HAD-IC family P-type ATPase, partial [Trinickia sp.]|uniref:HAD-IC family P-type ATPase n=1 Tax=Trinickia sp. TaxID=2571163 RepID=UPI003F7E9636
APQARVKRGGPWTKMPAAGRVPGDLVALSLGAGVPADARVVAGGGSLDQSALTGESEPADALPGQRVYAGSTVSRGSMQAIVTATGSHTYFGRAAELVKVAHAPSAEQRAIFEAVRVLALFNGFIATGTLLYAYSVGMQLPVLLRVAITALLATVPVALPATFALSASVSALALSRCGALLTRLSAVHEAASMDVLCSDKTGTLTENRMKVERVVPLSDQSADEVLAYAALTCDETEADPLDAAIVRADGQPARAGLGVTVERRVPFDPQTKVAQAWGRRSDGGVLHVVKGALQAVEAAKGALPLPQGRLASDDLATQGYRVIAVAIGDGAALRLIGLIALSDPPRPDARALIGTLSGLGIRTVMVTGDSAPTASAVARKVGLRDAPCVVDASLDASSLSRCDVYARVLPEDKFRLVELLQGTGRIVGMCGDGANDAPALRQAQVGIAVSNATDVAKAAAAIVLTEPGLAGIVATVDEGRRAHHRLLTYALNMLVKKVEVVMLLALGLVLRHVAWLTPATMVILLVTNDFLTMSITTDRATPSPSPSVWNMKRIAIAAVAIGFAKLAFSAMVVEYGALRIGLPVAEQQTLAFVAVALGNQAALYVLRERRRLWCSWPGPWLAASSVADVGIVALLSLAGIGMHALPYALVGAVALGAAAFALILDQLKLPLMRAMAIG